MFLIMNYAVTYLDYRFKKFEFMHSSERQFTINKAKSYLINYNNVINNGKQADLSTATQPLIPSSQPNNNSTEFRNSLTQQTNSNASPVLNRKR